MELSLGFRVYEYNQHNKTAAWVEYEKLKIVLENSGNSPPLITLRNNECTLPNTSFVIQTTYSTFCHFLKLLPDSEMPKPYYPCKGDDSLLVIEEISSISRKFYDRYQVIAIDTSSKEKEDKRYARDHKRELLTTLNARLMFSRKGFLYQLGERFRRLIHKSTKEILKLTLQRLTNDPQAAFLPSFQVLSKLNTVVQKDPSKMQDSASFENLEMAAKNLIYKTLLGCSMFPAFVEINTMGANTWLRRLKIKVMKKFSDIFTSPWGPLYHASFIFGRRRFNFINDPIDPHYKNRLLVTDLDRRSFNGTTNDKNFFQLKLFDFFPLDSWIEDIWIFIRDKILKLKDMGFSKLTLESYIMSFQTDEICAKISEEFYTEYIERFPEETWIQFAAVLADLELRSYALDQNNCQTLVSELVYIFTHTLQKHIEPKLDLNYQLLEILHGKDKWETVLLDGLNKFSSKSIPSKVVSFRLIHKLDYFGFYADEYTQRSLSPQNFEKLKESLLGNDYLHKLKLFYDDFCPEMDVFYDRPPSFFRVSTTSNGPTARPVSIGEKEERMTTSRISEKSLSMQPMSDIKQELKNMGNRYDYLHYLIHCVYNDLFRIKKEIQVIKSRVVREKKNIGAHIKNVDWLSVEPNTLEPLYREKAKKKIILYEICFYFFNGLRVSLLTKERQDLTYIGPVIVTNPECPGKKAT